MAVAHHGLKHRRIFSGKHWESNLKPTACPTTNPWTFIISYSCWGAQINILYPFPHTICSYKFSCAKKMPGFLTPFGDYLEQAKIHHNQSCWPKCRVCCWWLLQFPPAVSSFSRPWCCRREVSLKSMGCCLPSNQYCTTLIYHCILHTKQALLKAKFKGIHFVLQRKVFCWRTGCKIKTRRERFQLYSFCKYRLWLCLVFLWNSIYIWLKSERNRKSFE